ncbi:hypothetical protein Trydic_g2491 [Trypoxylus dichotomus]
MADQRKIMQKLKVGKDFVNDSSGIIYTIKPPINSLGVDDDSVADIQIFQPRPDPVKEHNRKARKRSKSPMPLERPATPETLINPSLSTRMDLSKPACMRDDLRHPGDALVKYNVPKPKGSRKAAKERRKEEQENRLICEYDVLRIPSPTAAVNLQEFEMISPEVSKAKVMPMKPSATSADLYPDPPTKDELALHKPRSGILINVTDEVVLSSSSSDEDEQDDKDKDKIPSKESDRLSTIEDVTDEDDWEELGEDAGLFRNEATAIDEDQPLRMIRKQVSQTSKTTSLNEKDFMYEDINWEQIPAICKLVQTFRSEQEEDARRKKKRLRKGTLESHSFTKIKQKTADEFCFKCLMGTIHQGDDNFSSICRNKQGICMPVAAYCYSKLKKTEQWYEKTIDDVVEIGNKFYLDSIGTLHMHKERKELSPKELQRFCVIDGKKVKYEIDEPEVGGQIRSLDKKIFNVTKGLKIFFHRHKAALFQATDFNLAIWKYKKYFYIFDAAPRRKDIYQDPNGKACLVCLQNIKAVISVLLDKTNLGNSAFLLSRIKIIKVMNVEDPDEDVADMASNYNILNDRKAVVQGTFDLGDKCFMFTRNKQALTMSTVALVYSRITSPSTWRRKTVDKIMIVGNQLYAEIVRHENAIEIGLDNLPALFTIGPYIVEIYIYANCHADTMFKKGNCAFYDVLNQFFEENNNALVQIGKRTIAIWHQRNMYYCFDPYSRNAEGLKCRNGSACVSMNADIETLVFTVVANFDNPDVIFYIHALKVVKIHRDPAMGRLFPRSLTLNEVPIENFKKSKLRKSKKKALEKPIRTNFTEYAMKKLLAGESTAPSLVDIGSNIGSLNCEYLPPFMQKQPPKEVIKTKLNELTDVADLDSPSLSETQILPVRPTPLKNEEELTLMDLDSFDLTQEELELQDEVEGETDYSAEGESKMLMVGEDYEDEGENEGDEGEGDFYTGRSAFSQVNSSSLESTHRHIPEEVNTDITYCYKIIPALEHTLKSEENPDKAFIINEDLQNLELKRETAFGKRWKDGMQLMVGSKKLCDFGEEVIDMSCYVCIMAAAYAQEQSLYKWTKKSVDIVLKGGVELYKSFQLPYTRVEDFNLQFKKHEMVVTLDLLLDTYVAEIVLSTNATNKVTLEALLLNYVFSKTDYALLFMNDYSYTMFIKRNLLYLYEASPKQPACLSRFKRLSDLVNRILTNREPQLSMNEFCKEYTRVVLIKPVVGIVGGKIKETEPSLISEHGDLLEPEVTQSKELAKPHNFVDLPDGTQLLRGTTEIKNYGESPEAMAPYVCIMAPAVGAKYSVSTWSSDVVNYVLQCGVELYKKSNIKFEEVAKLEIPKVSLGSTDFSLEVNYHYDAPMKHAVLVSSLKKILKQNGEWVVIVTQEFACAAYYKNHLYYLYDCYPSNEVGLSDGPDTVGYASFSRFKDLSSIATRIIYNKVKREDREQLEYTRFVLSTVKVRYVTKEQQKKGRKKAKDSKPAPSDMDETDEEDELLQQGEGDIPEEPPEGKKKRRRTRSHKGSEIGEDEEEEGEEESEEEKEPKNKIGFYYKDGFYVAEGTKSLEGSHEVSHVLKEDHFVCLCACLMVINCTIEKWDTKKIDLVIDQGKHIYSHATNVEISDKRTIKNILMCKHFFDVIVRPIKINNWRKNKNIDVGLKTIFSKRKFCLVQFPNCCIVVYKEFDFYYLFSPYSWTYKNSDNEEKTINAGWIRYTNEKRMKQKVKSFMVKQGNGVYAFYSFEVISLRRAPKKALIGHKLMKYEVIHQPKQEIMGKPFHEQKSWLDIHQYPWSRMKDETAGGKTRGKRDSKWHNWDIEYTNDLYSLAGTLHQTSKKFALENRGKQTLSNLVVAIAMTNIYELSEWNAAILDSVLANGDHYFSECIKDISEQNYELAMEDLIEDCSIFPYTFKVAYTPAIEGTMFLANVKKFNLYKALRYFFENYESRCGILIAYKGENKRLVAFGKTQENEYFMYDCQSMGPPMFFETEGASYILRCITLARLLHVLILTLKGGDFYIYDVETYEFKPMS